MVKNLYKRISKFFKQFDYFGVTLNFQVKEKNNFKSTFGGITSAIFFILSMIYCVTESIQFINRSQVNIIYGEELGDTAPEINFFNYSMKMAFGIDPKDPNLFPIVEEYFDVTLNSRSLLKREDGIHKTKISLKLNKCEYHDFDNKINKTFDSIGLKNFLCPDMKNDTIKGIYTSDDFKYFELVFSIKPQMFNSTNISKIKKFLIDNEVQANIFYIDTSISIMDYSSPKNYFLNSKFQILNWRFYKKLNLDFHPYIFTDDKNILYEQEKENEFLILGDKYEYFWDLGEERTENNNILSKIFLRSSSKKIFMKRIYSKLPDLLANVTGMISTALLFIIILVVYVNEFKAQQSVMKKILMFKDNLHDKKFESINYLKQKFCRDFNEKFTKIENNKKNNSESINSNDSSSSNQISSENYNSNGNMFTQKEIQHFQTFSNNKKEIQNYDSYKVLNNSLVSQEIDFYLNHNNNNTCPDKNNYDINKIVIKNKKLENEIEKIPYNLLNMPKYKKHSKLTFLQKLNFTRTRQFHDLFKLRINSKRESINNNLNNYFNKKQDKLIPMNFSVFEILSRIFCSICPNKKYKMKNELLRKGFNIFNYHMNILSYIRKMQEIDILKYLILDDNQITLFNFASKPSVSIAGQNQITEDIYQRFNVELNKGEVDKLISAFNHLDDKEELNELNKKLLSMVSTEIDNLISD